MMTMNSKMSGRKLAGFALPTVLIAAVILLMVLVTAVSATVAIRSSLKDNDQMKLASLASEAGVAFAKACLSDNNNKVTWSDLKPLKPNTDCSGNIRAGVSEFVLESDELRTYFIVNQPIASNVTARGYVEILRTTGDSVWKTFTSDTAYAQSASDSNPVGTSLEGYWTSAPPGYLLEDGSAVSRTTYADLFAVIGTTFGAGNGSTTFNVPDSRGRGTIALSGTADFNTIGQKAGAKTHTHALSNSGWALIGWNVNNQYFGATTVTTNQWMATLRFPGSASAYAGTSTTTVYDMATSLGGATNSGNSLDPYIVVLRVIKY